MNSNEDILYSKNQYKVENFSQLLQDPIYKVFNYANLKRVHKFHQSIPGYKETPLVKLESFASELGTNSVFVKDESKRFNLNAFKVLGASYSLACQLVNPKPETDIKEISGIFKHIIIKLYTRTSINLLFIK